MFITIFHLSQSSSYNGLGKKVLLHFFIEYSHMTYSQEALLSNHSLSCGKRTC